jgi:hypothetical protein
MFEMGDAAIYRERAEMHEQLAAATSDEPARKMHLAMAAEYRRKAAEAGNGMIEMAPIAGNGGSMLLAESPPLA